MTTDTLRVGDFIVAGDNMGTVMKIGVKTTRLRSIEGEELVIPNRELTNARVRNFKRMHERRVMFTFGLPYDTPTELLEKVSPILKEIIESQEHTKFHRAHFQAFTESRLQFEVVYMIDQGEHNVYAAIQEKINLEIMKRLQKLGVTFAPPARVSQIPGMGYLEKERPEIQHEI